MSRSETPFDPDAVPPLGTTERDRWREGLALLAPSEALAGAVEDIARDTPVRRPSPWRSRRGWWTVAAAAAVALVALWIPNLGPASEDVVPTESGDEEVARLVMLPPSVHEVRDARGMNKVPYFADGLGWLQKGFTRGGGSWEMSLGEIIPPMPEAVHGWCVPLGREGLAGPRTYEHGWLPRPGVMLVGRELLAKLGVTTFFADGVLRMRTPEGKTWSAEEGSEAELVLGGPHPEGPKARVRVLVSTAYTGSILVEGPLARALGLHQYELPGGMQVGKEPTLRGHRAWARIRIDALDFEDVLDVQVMEDRDLPAFLPSGKQRGRISVTGAPPNRIAHADHIHVLADGTRNVEDQDGGMTLGLDRHAERVRATLFEEGPKDIALIYDMGEASETWLVAGRHDVGRPAPWSLALAPTWITLTSREEARSRIVISRVWHGTVAIPSAEGVIIAEADLNGSVRVPRLVGEAGGTLRMRVIPPSGEAFFRDIHVAPMAPKSQLMPLLKVDAGADISGMQQTREHGPWVPVSLSGRVAEAVRRIAGQRPVTSGDPVPYPLEIHVDDFAPWGAVAAILLTVQEEDVRLSDVVIHVYDKMGTEEEQRLHTIRLRIGAPLTEAQQSASDTLRVTFLQRSGVGTGGQLRLGDHTSEEIHLKLSGWEVGVAKALDGLSPRRIFLAVATDNRWLFSEAVLRFLSVACRDFEGTVHLQTTP